MGRKYCLAQAPEIAVPVGLASERAVSGKSQTPFGSPRIYVTLSRESPAAGVVQTVYDKLALAKPATLSRKFNLRGRNGDKPH